MEDGGRREGGRKGTWKGGEGREGERSHDEMLIFKMVFMI
jgi:hypothetical protein